MKKQVLITSYFYQLSIKFHGKITNFIEIYKIYYFSTFGKKKSLL